MYCVGLRLWPCKRSLVARALSLPTPALQGNTPPPYSPSASPRQQTTSSFRSLSVTLEQLQQLLLLPVPPRRPFCTAPPADPSPRGANLEVDSGNTKEGRPTSTGTAQAGGTRSADDDGAKERSSSAPEIDGENENTAASSPPPFAFPEKPPHETFHPDAAPGERQPQPRPPQPDDKTKRPPKKSAHAVAMEEFAALERKLASRSAAPPPVAPPTASRSSRAAEVTTNTNSSNTGNGNGNSSISNGSKEKRKTAEQVAMEEFAALERKILGSAGGGGGYSQGPKERVVSSSRNPRSAAVASARPEEPAAEECCGNGCANCVWIDYWEELQAWESQEQGREREKAPP